jgi:hypothetical protein
MLVLGLGINIGQDLGRGLGSGLMLGASRCLGVNVGIFMDHGLPVGKISYWSGIVVLGNMTSSCTLPGW